MIRSFIVSLFLISGLSGALAQTSLPLSALQPGNPITSTDIFYDVQAAGLGGVKVTASQLLTFMNSNIALTVGSTAINSGVINGLLFDNAGVLANSGPLVGAVSNPTGNGQWSIGATNTLGAIIIGEGSTDDFQLQNKAGTGVISVATGATTPTLNGITGSTQCLQVNTSGVVSGAGVTCGGTGAPGGTNTQLQYNNVGAFGGIIGATTNGTAVTFANSDLLLLGSSTGATTFTSANAGASNFTITVPAATDQLVARATSDTLTNKTYDTAGTGNVFKINGTQITAISGNTATVASESGTLVSGNCIKSDASHNLIDSGGACGGGSPAGSTGQIQYNAGAGAFGGAGLWRNSANLITESNGVTAQSLYVYNTTDTDGGTPTNFERGVFDFTTNANVLTIGTQKGGTGTGRSIAISSVNGTTTIQMGTQGIAGTFAGGNFNNFIVNNGGIGMISTNSIAIGGTAPDTGIVRIAPKVIAFNEGNTASPLGWMQWVGQTRVTGDVGNSTVTLAAATGLSVALAAGRTYSFDVYLSFTDAAAGGIQAAMVATGGLTATAIEYDGWIIDSGANGIKGNTQAAALGTVVASATTTGTAGVVQIKGTITVNVAGTLNVQFAQNTSSGTATTVKRGSYMIVHDMP